MVSGMRMRTAAVLGAGTMGSQIAAHLANAGLRVVLLDVTASQASEGLKRTLARKPDPFFTRDAVSLVSVGGFDADLEQVAEADWIIEAVVEQVDAKRALFERVESVRRRGSIVSSNTSGIPIASLGQHRSDDFRQHLLGTHFFNPPRYLHLLEVVATPDTLPDVVPRISWFADHRLGKGVVLAKDTPNFIANRLGVFGVVRMLRALESGEYTIEEIDAITGPALGRPKSATFRTMDISGIDVLAAVAGNLHERLSDEDDRDAFALPHIVESLIERGWLGEKAGQGFYTKQGDDILTLDAASLTYRPKAPVRLPSLEAVRSIDDPAERLRTLFLGQDKVGSFLRDTLGTLLLYAARVAPQIAFSIDDVDRAMRWGFGWELGPFESWDALGIHTVLETTKPAVVPPLVQQTIDVGRNRFRDGWVPPATPGVQILREAREGQCIVRKNSGASLIDLGDGALGLEFHSKMNTIGGDTVQMLHAGVKEAAANYAALVIGTDHQNFSAGANLMLVLLEAQEGNWDEVDLMVRSFQQAVLALRYSTVPVVVAPAGLALGGGCEIVMHGDHVQAAAEAYMGLVEVGVGLIPAGGGTKEMMARASRAAGAANVDLLATVQSAFETIAFAKTSTSAAHARQLGYLREQDAVTMNRDRLIADAKETALARARDGYVPPPPQRVRVGGENLTAALKLGVHLAWRAGRISDHDAVVGRALAHIMGGGNLPHAAVVDEGYLLDLEREAFLKLCGERKTLERIQHTLKTGKPLRN